MSALKNIHLQRIHWAISSPSLLSYPFCCTYFKDEKHELDVLEKLTELDAQPERVDAHFYNLRHVPMGKYFEQLLFFILKHDNRYELMLCNHQVKEGNRTVGELDLIVKDTQTRKREHWEIALKFYLQADSSREQRNMIGPNAIDNLARKMEKLTQHQMRLSEHSSIKYLVGAERTESKLFLKGQCFYHLNDTAIFPAESNPNHERGWWCHLSEIETMVSENLSWCILEKPDWIGFHQTNDDAQLLSARTIKSLVVKRMKKNAKALFVVGMNQTDMGWIEHTRGFIVDDTWPNRISEN